jgi:hypothetical protein
MNGIQIPRLQVHLHPTSLSKTSKQQEVLLVKYLQVAKNQCDSIVCNRDLDLRDLVSA